MSFPICNSYQIDGMNSDNCESVVQHKLLSVPGVSVVKIDRKNNRADITSYDEIETIKFQDALDQTNYTIGKLVV